MTATQIKRIRRNLAHSAELAEQAHRAAVAGHADATLIALCDRARQDSADAVTRLQAWDDRFRANADAIVRRLGV